MKIGLYNLEPKYKNLALEKIRLYHSRRGDKVCDYSPIESRSGFDAVYASSIFDFTPKQYVSTGMLIGGTGFDLITKLPPEIESTEPHLNFGYTTRGCCRNCPFCVVRRKEGELKATGDIESLWDGESKLITLLDNNALGLIEHFAMNCEQARKHDLTLDWNQGLDFRFINNDTIDLIKSVKHKELHFAFDNPKYADKIDKVITILQNKGIKRNNWYVLVGFDTTFEQDLFRLNFLRERGQNAYVQRFRSKKKLGWGYIALAEWANQHHIFQAMTWEQFLNHKDNSKYRALKHLPEVLSA